MQQACSRFLLVAALVLGQWLALAHDYQHPALNGDETCQVCLHAPNAHVAPAAAAELVAAEFGSEAPAIPPSAPAIRRQHSPANSRAPPSIPV